MDRIKILSDLCRCYFHHWTCRLEEEIRTSEPRRFEIRFFGIMSILVATLILMYGTTFRGDPEITQILLIATMMLTIGITFGALMTGLRFKFWDMEIIETLLWTGASFGGILVVNQLVPIQFDVTGISPRLLGVLVGVSEELFFRVWLCGVASKFNQWGAILGSSAVWSAYHIARYGGSFNVLFLIFVAGCMLGWIYLNTKVADGVIFAHALVNWFALA